MLRRFTAAACLIATCAFQPLFAQQAEKPVGIVSIAPIEDLLPNLKYVMKASGQAAVGGIVRTYVDQYSEGMDRSKPIGVLINMEGQAATAVAFLPVVDKDAVFESLSFFGIEPDELGDNTYEFFVGQPIYAKQVGSWMYIAQTEDAFEGLPADPTTFLGRLPDRYDIAVKLNLQNVPSELKEFGLAQLRSGFENGMLEQGGLSEAQIEANRKAGEMQIAQLEKLVNETEQAILGWAVDEENQKTYLDFASQAVSGTSMAVAADSLKDLSSKFGAFEMPGSCANLRFTSAINSEEEKALQKMNLQNSFAQAKTQISQGDMPAEAAAFLEKTVDAVSRVLEASIDEGVFDGAVSVSVADDNPTLVLAGHVADGNMLAKEIQTLAADIPDAPTAPKFTFDIGTHKGFTLHKVVVPLKTSNPKAKEIYGEQILLNVGIADKTAVIALEKSGDAVLKAAIDRFAGASSETVIPAVGTVELLPFLKYAQFVSPNSMLDLVLETANEHADVDNIEVQVRAIERGSIARFTLEEGILRVIGAASAAGQAQPAGF